MSGEASEGAAMPRHEAGDVSQGADQAQLEQLEATVSVGGSASAQASCCEEPTSGAGAAGNAASEGDAPAFHVDSLFPHRIDVSASPGHVDAGETCGMSWMCGEHPCLCGESDEWGDCACNGTHAVAPDVSVQSSDPGVAVFELGGAWHAFALGPAEADLAVTASLPHYRDFQQTVHLSCGGPGTGALVAVALVAALLAVCVGVVAAAMRKRRRRTSAAGGGDAARREAQKRRALLSLPDSRQHAEGPGDRASCSDGSDERRQNAPATGERP